MHTWTRTTRRLTIALGITCGLAIAGTIAAQSASADDVPLDTTQDATLEATENTTSTGTEPSEGGATPTSSVETAPAPGDTGDSKGEPADPQSASPGTEAAPSNTGSRPPDGTATGDSPKPKDSESEIAPDNTRPTGAPATAGPTVAPPPDTPAPEPAPDDTTRSAADSPLAATLADTAEPAPPPDDGSQHTEVTGTLDVTFTGTTTAPPGATVEYTFRATNTSTKPTGGVGHGFTAVFYPPPEELQNVDLHAVGEHKDQWTCGPDLFQTSRPQHICVFNPPIGIQPGETHSFLITGEVRPSTPIGTLIENEISIEWLGHYGEPARANTLVVAPARARIPAAALGDTPVRGGELPFTGTGRLVPLALAGMALLAAGTLALGTARNHSKRSDPESSEHR